MPPSRVLSKLHISGATQTALMCQGTALRGIAHALWADLKLLSPRPPKVPDHTPGYRTIRPLPTISTAFIPNKSFTTFRRQ